MPEPELPSAEEDTPGRRLAPWMAWAGVAVLVLVSAAILVTAPRAPNSQAAMGQGLPSTSFGEISTTLEAVELGFLPAGFALVTEESDGIDRVVQRYRRDGDDGRQLLVVTTIDGGFDAAKSLGANARAEPVTVAGVDGVLVRDTTETGEAALSLRVQVGDAHNVIVRGIGAIPLEDLVAVAASAQES